MATKQDAVLEIAKNKQQAQRVFLAITKVVETSFSQDLIIRPQVTQDEIKRRANLCYDWFLVMRTDLGYSTSKALSMLPKALRCSLDGTPFEPGPADRSYGQSKVKT
jgi:hypothetical protein